ncbi:hypothetical protein OE88DRAFT_1678295 [Heliocybe sulcata]|uniref:Rho termination factor-like N-terminal domain-containing protein n=1 Tax=Heliocybe sulcata TaxID=5364 RepID=A0A5C3N8J4_9AGAM|nr:hypothetical protein OE88DRAFT_1678295 [Heliocybe sulcata]
MATSTNDLNKLTVAQLKAICKEKGISGYSKLNKPALLQRIVDYNKSTGSGTASATRAIEPSQLSNASGLDPAHTTAPHSRTIDRAPIPGELPVLSQPPPPERRKKRPITSNTEISAPQSKKSKTTTNAHGTTEAKALTPQLKSQNVMGPPSVRCTESSLAPPGSLNTPNSSSIPRIPTTGRESTVRKATGPLPTSLSKNSTKSALPSSEPPQAQAKRMVSEARKASRTQGSVVQPLEIPHSGKFPAVSGSITPSRAALAIVQDRSQAVAPQSTEQVSAVKTLPPARKFKPLVSCKAAVPSLLSPQQPRPSVSSLNISSAEELFLFASTPYPIPACPRITLPPSLSQRKRVHIWALFLSLVPSSSLHTCTLVSKMFRYAIYLSALAILQRDFPGKRLEHVLSKYAREAKMTSFWPYLRERRRERSRWEDAYRESFLPAFFEGAQPISERMWTSPEDDRQTGVALRFVMTRLWFAISIGKLQPKWGIVTSAETVVDDIWMVKVQYSTSPGHEETFYILEPTCEVIGRPSHSSGSNPESGGLPVRADWSAYIDRFRSGDGANGGNSILSRLRWENYEEYDGGISKLWLNRIESEGEVGRAKRLVAQRYVLACVVANSISGQWMSSTQMAQDFAGLSAGGTGGPRHGQTQVNLYLPLQVSLCSFHPPLTPSVRLHPRSHHHVESVHFTTPGSSRQSIHRAVAVVQTPAREYFVLRDNGMQIGCEEEGVGEVWMQALGCAASGVKKWNGQ